MMVGIGTRVVLVRDDNGNKHKPDKQAKEVQERVRETSARKGKEEEARKDLLTQTD